jgi:mycothiol synthase
MTVVDIEIKKFDPGTATQEQWVGLNSIRSRLQAERQPDDPPEKLEKTKAFISNIPAFVDFLLWTAQQPGHTGIVATSYIALSNTEDNRHLAQFNISVLPEFRREGIGSRLLAGIAEVARDAGRSLLISDTQGSVPAGAAFMTRIGARVGLETHVNQLDVARVDPDLLREWQERSHDRAAAFELGLWEGPYPEGDIEGIVALKKAMNLAPRGDLDVEDFDLTAEHLRQVEESHAARGIQRWSMYVRDTASGELAGYTEVWWNPDEPSILRQEDTAVWPTYRNLGLGRWLKAAMLEKALRECPSVRYVRTDNADTNAPMLKINEEMGFKPYLSNSVWQVELSGVLDYLHSRA